MQENMTTSELLTIAIEIGQQMLESGAEIYRVEDSISRICIAYGAHDTHVYAVPTSIIATAARPGEPPLTRTRRIRSRGTNLDRLDRLNALCRALCAQPMSECEVRAALEHIAAQSNYYPVWALRVAFGLVAGLFTLLFGGDLRGAAVAFGAGFCLKIALDALERMQVNSLFMNIVGGALIAAFAVGAATLGIVTSYDRIIVGSIMTMVPGLAITNAIRDLIAGDSIAGITKFTEALLVAIGIAIGVALPLSALHLWEGLGI